MKQLTFTMIDEAVKPFDQLSWMKDTHRGAI